jgi:hypothetical protein
MGARLLHLRYLINDRLSALGRRCFASVARLSASDTANKNHQIDGFFFFDQLARIAAFLRGGILPEILDSY